MLVKRNLNQVKFKFIKFSGAHSILTVAHFHLKNFHGPFLKVLLSCNFSIFCDLLAISKKKKKKRGQRTRERNFLRIVKRSQKKRLSLQTPQFSDNFWEEGGHRAIALWPIAMCSYSHRRSQNFGLERAQTTNLIGEDPQKKEFSQFYLGFLIGGAIFGWRPILDWRGAKPQVTE